MCLYEFSNSSYYFFCKIEWIKIGWICDTLHLWMFLQFLCNNFDTVHRIQTKFGMDILLDPRNKPAKEFFIFSQNPRWPPAVKNLRRVILFQCFCNNFDPVNRIQTQFVMNILLHPRNNPAEEFFIFLKIQDGCSRNYGKLRNRS